MRTRYQRTHSVNEGKRRTKQQQKLQARAGRRAERRLRQDQRAAMGIKGHQIEEGIIESAQ